MQLFRFDWLPHGIANKKSGLLGMWERAWRARRKSRFAWKKWRHNDCCFRLLFSLVPESLTCSACTGRTLNPSWTASTAGIRIMDMNMSKLDKATDSSNVTVKEGKPPPISGIPTMVLESERASGSLGPSMKSWGSSDSASDTSILNSSLRALAGVRQKTRARLLFFSFVLFWKNSTTELLTHVPRKTLKLIIQTWVTAEGGLLYIALFLPLLYTCTLFMLLRHFWPLEEKLELLAIYLTMCRQVLDCKPAYLCTLWGTYGLTASRSLKIH